MEGLTVPGLMVKFWFWATTTVAAESATSRMFWSILTIVQWRWFCLGVVDGVWDGKKVR